MRVTSRAATVTHEERWRRDRAAAQTLRSAFPAVASIRIELTFEDPGAQSPAPQSHVMHPPVRAFFEFRCPYANCDGKFDLSSVAGLVMTRASGRTTGSLECTGTRSRGGPTKQTCGVRLRYVVAAEYHPRAAGAHE
jgi:hypothetical protein